MAWPERTAGIVLAGGASERMGSPKATLEWHGSTLVRRAAGLVARAVDGPVVVVRAAGQELPALPGDVEIADDLHEGRGPLQGMAAGLGQIGDRAGIVFITGVDTPLLHPAFIACVVRSLGPGDEVALPRARGFDHHLAAAYRRAALSATLGEQIAGDRLRTGALVARLRVRALDEAALLDDPEVAAQDPGLHSLLNLNTPQEYDAARAMPRPRIIVRPAPRAAGRAVSAATLGQAMAAAGVTLGRQTVAVLAGHGPVADPQEPLAGGDELTVQPLATRTQAP